MHHLHPNKAVIGRRNRLCQVLGLALGLGLASAWLAQPAAAATTWQVQNCNDSGSNSLRGIIANKAASGDTVKLNGLNCTISLQSTIDIHQSTLDISGWHSVSGEFSPTPTISGSGSHLVFSHSASSGLLTLRSVRIADGFDNRAGCVHSNASVILERALVEDCTTKTTNHLSGGDVNHGAVFAVDGLAVTDSTVRNNSVSWDVLGGYPKTRGAGIGSDGDVGLIGSVVANNTAGGAGRARGGGIYAGGGLWMTTSIVTNNELTSSSVYGIGIYAAGGNVHVAHSEISSNRAPGANGGSGGGIYLDAGGEIEYSIITDNQVPSSGGGVFSGGDITIKSSTLSNNSVSSSLGGGGGLAAVANVSIESSTVSGNTSGSYAAGATLGRNAATPVVIRNSTIVGNETTHDGAGAGLLLEHDTLIENSTIAANKATGSSQPVGAGISLEDQVVLDISSSIVAGNTLAGGVASDIGLADAGNSVLVSGNYSLVSASSVPLPGDTLFAADPMLGPLQDNGGPTPTRMPLEHSPALATGIANGLDWDQRGAGHPRGTGAGVEIGAVEAVIDDRIFADDFAWYSPF